ncbi:MAG: hypothetical protein HFJ68_05615 [Adlercreutzia caecimuris]|nr:hypothetical protein [Adlercreutzia caecimuris]MCI9208015.1 hypothetical protein [Adlercreutzia caecimuris]
MEDTYGYERYAPAITAIAFFWLEDDGFVTTAPQNAGAGITLPGQTRLS